MCASVSRDISTHLPYMSHRVLPFLNKMAPVDSLQRVRNWFSQSKLGEYADLCISNGFDSLELSFECVDKQLLEEQFAELKEYVYQANGSSCS